MPNKNYERGRASEYKACEELRDLHYEAVRTAGSHGAADVIAWNDRHIRFIQIKTFKIREGDYAKDSMALITMALPPDSQAEIWTRKTGQRGWFRQETLRANGCEAHEPLHAEIPRRDV